MLRIVLLVIVTSLTACAKTPAQTLEVPSGFEIAVFRDEVPAARAMALGTRGTVFVGSNSAGKVYALTDADHHGQAERMRVVASGLKKPLGVAFHAGDLYISDIDRILKLRDIEEHLDQPPTPEVITDRLPDKTHHGGRFIAFGPNGKLYVAIGAPCNVCDRDGYAKLLRMDADGGNWEDVAYGIRNSVGFAWQPGTDVLWFTDNGRDMLGDNLPSDELNRVTKLGQHFGFPYCHQGDILDPEYGKGKSCADYVAPAANLGAHVAALGMMFYTGDMFPPRYRGSVLLAEHGSWNRSTKSGYQVVMVPINGNNAGVPEPFVTGFLKGQATLGRPVDVLQLKDGSVLVSDDYNDAVYRVTYAATGAATDAATDAQPAPAAAASAGEHSAGEHSAGEHDETSQ